MRLTGGLDRGRRLFVPRGSRTRPTAAKVREAIFNILGPPPGPVLDLYAGSGALGIEALSRGAGSVTFVEREPRLAAALKANLSRLKTDGEVVGDDAARWLKGSGKPFDLVFLDPPFALDAWAGIAAQLESGGWLTPTAWIYVESPRGAVFTLPPTWLAHRQGQAGEVTYTLYRRAPADPLS